MRRLTEKRRRRELKKLRREYMKNRRRRAGGRIQRAALACAVLAVLGVAALLQSGEEILNLASERKIEFKTDGKAGREEGERCGVIFRLKDGEITFFHEKKEAE